MHENRFPGAANDNVSIFAFYFCHSLSCVVTRLRRSPIKLMPRSQPQSTKDEKCGSNTAKSQPLSALVGANALEKSKSDSKLDQFANQENLSASQAFNRDEDYIRRSNSNQNMERKSPTKKKKAKSFSKLSELDKEVLLDYNDILLNNTFYLKHLP